MKFKTLSIAMATFNGERYLEEQLASFTAQSLQPRELVVTDDGSTDRTEEIILKYAKDVPFAVRFIKNPERLGYRANFMKAASLCTSDCIAFSDQDDVWMPEKLELTLSQFRDEETLLVYHNATVVDAQLNTLGSLSNRAPRNYINSARSLEPWHYSLGFTLTIDRRLTEYSDLWKNSFDFLDAKNVEAHDQWFFFLASSLGTINYLREPLVLYRQHNTNTAGWHKATWVDKNIANFLTTSVYGLVTLEKSASARALALQNIAEGKVFSINAGLAAEGYRKLETLYKTRRAMYNAEDVTDRAKTFLSLLREGGYGPRSRYGVGKKAILRDLVYGIALPPLFKVKTPKSDDKTLAA